MKVGLIVVLALVLTAFGAHFLLADPGYVVINFRGYVVEMSVPVLVGLAIALVLLVWLIRKIILAPRRLGEAAGRYRSARSGKKLTKGMIAVAEGNLARGERLLGRAASTSDSPTKGRLLRRASISSEVNVSGASSCAILRMLTFFNCMFTSTATQRPRWPRLPPERDFRKSRCGAKSSP